MKQNDLLCFLKGRGRPHVTPHTQEAALMRLSVTKAEVVRYPGRDPKSNPRFLVTILPDAPQAVYEEIYCRRGDVENRLKELHHGLEMDRTGPAARGFWPTSSASS